MVIFSLKLLNNLRKAIAGRRFPHQLAGGVALGVLLGVIPHGNLLALAVLLVVLCFRVNHAMTAVVAIAVTFGATSLDPVSHQIGERVLTHPDAQTIVTDAWTWPLVPWTDLNNTVVMGSFLIGVASVLPVFVITLPFFRWIAPAEDEEGQATKTLAQDLADDMIQGDTSESNGTMAEEPDTAVLKEEHETAKHSVTLFDPEHEQSSPPRFEMTEPENSEVNVSNTDRPGARTPTDEETASVETRIDVIRMADYQSNENATGEGSTETSDGAQQPPMDEALRYLLRQLRDSQQRKAAG